MRIINVLLFVSILSCKNRDCEIFSNVIKATLSSCDNNNCIYFNHIEEPKDENQNNHRDHILISTKTNEIAKASDLIEVLKLSECSVSPIRGEISSLRDGIELILEGSKISFVDIDTISNITSYIEEIEYAGMSGILIFKTPLLIKCTNKSFIISGIEWKRNQTLFLFEMNNNSLELKKII